MYNTVQLDKALEAQKVASQKLIDRIDVETNHGQKQISMFVTSVRGENDAKRNNKRTIQQ
jgi:hypothetical protein